MSPAARARGPAAKLERHAALLAAGARLFAERDYAEVGIAGIAREAGLAKGTVYLYFPTKEALFLELLLDQLGGWLDALSQGFAPRPGGDRRAAFARRVARSFEGRPTLLRLLAILHTVLEQNVDGPTALRFKLGLAERMAGPARVLEERLELRRGDGIRLLLRAHALTVGLAQMSRPAPCVLDAIRADPRLAAFEIDFARELEAALGAMLRGW